IAGKDNAGRTQTLWDNENAVNLIPVDCDKLMQLRDLVDGIQRDLPTSRWYFAEGTYRQIQYVRDMLGRFLRLAYTDVAREGHVSIRYRVAATGRLFATGISLQTLPRIIRRAALHGMWDYDIENCHYAIFHQLAEKYEFRAQVIELYLRHKKAIREE